MINFFRKIRKQLADDNKFFKYSRYAIGEIVLVVIGILIALSINNWNEQRKKISEENELLGVLLQELESNVKNINRVISWLEAIKSTGKKSLDFWANSSSNDMIISADQVLADLSWFLGEDELESDVLDMLNLQLINNKSLRHEISLWRKNMSLLETVLEQDYDHYSNAWVPYLRKHASMPQLSNAIESSPINKPWNGFHYAIEDKRIDHAKIFEDQEFQNLVVHKIWIQNDILNYISKLQTQLKLLIEMVRSESLDA
jgi:hypothetical protein